MRENTRRPQIAVDHSLRNLYDYAKFFSDFLYAVAAIPTAERPLHGVHMSRLDASVIAFLVTVLSILILHPVARVVGMVDRPGGRKLHHGEVPVIGGICMFFGLFAALPLVVPAIYGQTQFLLGAAVLVLVGAVDDRLDLHPRIRLMAQATAGLILCSGAGLTADNLGAIFFMDDVRLGPFATLFTLLVVMSAVNAFNFLDGMDGLAGGVALSSCITVAVAASLADSDAGLTLAVLAVAVLIGFLVFNFPTSANRNVRTFMGDAGATMLGFIVVWLGLRISSGPDAFLPAVVALWIAALPISDFFNSFVRRLSRGQSPMKADREHFHHYLQRAGLTDREVMVAMSALSLLLGLTGILAHRAGIPDGMLFFGFLSLCLLQNRVMKRLDRVVGVLTQHPNRHSAR